jgi:hypothetical protein
MFASTLRVAGLAIAAIPALGLLVSDVPLEFPMFILVALTGVLFLVPAMRIGRTRRIPARLVAPFLGVHAPIATYVLLTPVEQPRVDGPGVIYDTDMFRVPLLNILGARDQPEGNEGLDTLDTIAGISIAVAFVWSLGLYVVAVRIRRRHGSTAIGS